MAYGEATKNRYSIVRKIRVKSGKWIAGNFPLNKIRVRGLKLCGFQAGRKVYIGPGLMIASVISDKSCSLEINDRVAIGPRVTIVLSSDANWSKLMETIPFVRSTVILDEDCWIGAGAIILPGVTVGKMSIVGAGAVVDKNVEPYSIVAGVPAKKIKDIPVKPKN